jgi:mercuric ion transport protein
MTAVERAQASISSRAPRGGETIGARRAGTLTAGASILGAIAASSCCVVPFVLFSLGVSGAWIGRLTALAPYQPYFVALTMAFLAVGFVLVYRRPAAPCADGSSYCAQPSSRRIAKTGLWTAAVLVAIALVFPSIVPLIFPE